MELHSSKLSVFDHSSDLLELFYSTADYAADSLKRTEHVTADHIGARCMGCSKWSIGNVSDSLLAF
jgi:hypothetical protein